MLHDLTDDDSFVYSNGQLRTERYGDKEKGCQRPAVQQKITEWVAVSFCLSLNILTGDTSSLSVNQWSFHTSPTALTLTLLLT